MKVKKAKNKASNRKSASKNTSKGTSKSVSKNTSKGTSKSVSKNAGKGTSKSTNRKKDKTGDKKAEKKGEKDSKPTKKGQSKKGKKVSVVPKSSSEVAKKVELAATEILKNDFLETSREAQIERSGNMREQLISIINQGAKEAKIVFQNLAKEGFVWNDILNVFVLDKNEENKAQNEEIMHKLILFRDTYDHYLYKTIANDIFGNVDFTVTTNPNAFINEDTFDFMIKYYQIKVFEGANTGYNFNTNNKPYIEITVIAPGSRTLTSDIDTTISVQGVETFSKSSKFKLAKQLNIKEPDLDIEMIDFNTIIKKEVIKGFYSASQKECGITSSQSRDSNVYSDGFMKKNKEEIYTDYSKLTLLKRDIDVIGDPSIIENPYQFYNENKKKKQQYELAASLVPLRWSLSSEEWINFKVKVKDNIEKTFDPDEFKLSLIHDNLKNVYLLVDRLVDEAKTKLETAIKEHEKDFINSPLNIKEKQVALKNDIYISNMNDLYIKELEKIVFINQELNKIKAEQKTLIPSMKGQFEKLSNKQNYLKRLRKKLQVDEPILPEEKLEEIRNQESQVASMLEQYENNKKALKYLLKKEANFINEKQIAQIKANLFANEAYINRSAVFHVVEGMQKKGKTKLSKQVVMGSVLQQIGIKLFHEKTLREEGIIEKEEIAYKTSKYGYRVADMVFDQIKSPISNEKLLGDIQSGDIPIFTRLRKEKTNMSALFNEKEYELLNSEIFINKIKKDTNIPEHRKFEETQKALVHQAEHRELLLSIAQKTLTISYKSRLKEKGKLWGEYIPPLPPVIIEGINVMIFNLNFNQDLLQDIRNETLTVFRNKIYMVKMGEIRQDLSSYKGYLQNIDFNKPHDYFANIQTCRDIIVNLINKQVEESGLKRKPEAEAESERKEYKKMREMGSS